MIKVEFGLKVATFSSGSVNGPAFIERILNFIKGTRENYRTIWFSDHLTPWTKGMPQKLDTLECFTTVSYLSGVFPDRRFGTAVLSNSFRNPALLAKMVATLDELTGGRFILGIGAGWREEEYREYGYEFPPPAVRIRQLSEGLQIVRKLWTEDNVSFDGRYFKVSNLTCYPHPNPCPKIMVGGGGESLTLRVVARYADWWNLGASSVNAYKHKMDVLAEHCDKVGRKFDSIRKTAEVFIALGKTKEEAVGRVLTGRQAHFVGTPEEAVAWFGGFIDLGVDYFEMRFLDEPRTDGANLFAEKVIPKLR
ncbi:LLM class flavin-dependent oxidoreductase [Candidatus Bathyarchaeota archaeon]|nr:LLM class flavin-dependent oxidoreductase [Candidatus Bathyarchaeota archaeon]